VRVKEQAAVEVSSRVQQRAAPSTIAMQARLGNGVVLSWPQVGIPVDRDRSFRFVVTGDSGGS